MQIRCKLDQDGCIDLLTVLKILNQISQEQAWAICYELAKLMTRLTNKKRKLDASCDNIDSNNCAVIDSLAQIQLHRDGHVHEKSCSLSYIRRQLRRNKQTVNSGDDDDSRLEAELNQNTADTLRLIDHHEQSSQPLITKTPPTPPITPDSLIEDEDLNDELAFAETNRRPASSESELVSSLGIALFWALDYGIADDQERKLSLAMEYLICQSQNCNNNSPRDTGKELSLRSILDVCIKRVPQQQKQPQLPADAYYREINKSLIRDAIELSVFLDKICTATMVLRDMTSKIGDSDCRCHGGLADDHIYNPITSDDENSLAELGEPLASLRALKISDWARLWMQVIRELRQKGKTFNNSIEFNSTCR